MALFQRKPQSITAPPLYTLGLNKTIIIAGLGNPGKEYIGTRHNIGFEVINALADKQDFDPWMEKKDLKCLLTTKTLGSTRVILVKPTTFMNISGEAVQAVSHFYKVDPAHLLVVHDELDIPFGQIRTRVGGSSAGHNGIKSVTQHLGEDYGRVRIGVKAETRMEASDFVLAKFSKEEQEHIPELIKESLAVLTEYIYGEVLPHETRNFIV
jgi:PTH1 family peptidyl-tRNA hydrolase